MTIRDLVERGYDVVSRSEVEAGNIYGTKVYTGSEYRKWLESATLFLEQRFPGEKATERFSDLASRADGNDTSFFDSMIGILEAYEDNLPKGQMTNIESIIVSVCENFSRFDVSIKRRHDERSTIEIKDEYDVQDALRSILKLFVNDIRPEDYVSEYAGGKSRVDFNLPEYGIVIETKMASSSLKDKAIGDQLIIDFHHYKALPGCKHLICFVYDKDSFISNPFGLKNDLEKLSDDELQMTVIIAP